MNRGALVQLKGQPWEGPGVVIKGSYGAVLTYETHHDGRAKLVEETKVVDVLVGVRIIEKIPVEKLVSLR